MHEREENAARNILAQSLRDAQGLQPDPKTAAGQVVAACGGRLWPSAQAGGETSLGEAGNEASAVLNGTVMLPVTVRLFRARGLLRRSIS